MSLPACVLGNNLSSPLKTSGLGSQGWTGLPGNFLVVTLGKPWYFSNHGSKGVLWGFLLHSPTRIRSGL